MQKRTAKKQRPTAITEPAVDPGRLDANGEDWVINMPEENEYVLQIDEWATGMNSPLQRIDLTRDEYIALKAELARMRGYNTAEVEHAA